MNGDQASRDRLKEARRVCTSYLEELAAKKRRKVQEAKSAHIARAGGVDRLSGGVDIMSNMAV